MRWTTNGTAFLNCAISLIASLPDVPSGTPASEAGSRFAERQLTVVASCRQQGRPLLDFPVATDEAALRGSSPLSLLRAGKGPERLLT